MKPVVDQRGPGRQPAAPWAPSPATAWAGSCTATPRWPGFPFGTLAVNLLGCLLIGLGAGLADARQAFTPEARLFVFVGLLGGFTTFSSFGYETIALLRDHELLRAGLNVGLNVFAGLALVWLGYALTTGR